MSSMVPRPAYASARVRGASAVVVTACVRYRSRWEARSAMSGLLVSRQSDHPLSRAGVWKRSRQSGVGRCCSATPFRALRSRVWPRRDDRFGLRVGRCRRESNRAADGGGLELYDYRSGGANQ